MQKVIKPINSLMKKKKLAFVMEYLMVHYGHILHFENAKSKVARGVLIKMNL